VIISQPFSYDVNCIDSVAGIHVLQKMDINKDGVISLEEFIETCRRVGQS